MKKSEVLEKQSEIKGWLKKIGLSQNEFAALFLLEHDDNCTEEEIKKFQENFKKQLSRQSIKIEKLETYLNYLFTTEKFKDAGYIWPQSYSDDILEPVAAKMMKKISKKLNEQIEL